MEMNKTIRNPTIGHQITFLLTADQTNGDLLQIMYAVEVPETKPAILLHIHLQCEERFEVVNGRLGVILNGQFTATWLRHLLEYHIGHDTDFF